MNVVELQVDGIASESRLAAARWELFVFPEIRHVCPLGAGGRVAVLYDGTRPDIVGWLSALAAAGFAAWVVGPTRSARAAA